MPATQGEAAAYIAERNAAHRAHHAATGARAVSADTPEPIGGVICGQEVAGDTARPRRRGADRGSEAGAVGHLRRDRPLLGQSHR